MFKEVLGGRAAFMDPRKRPKGIRYKWWWNGWHSDSKTYDGSKRQEIVKQAVALAEDLGLVFKTHAHECNELKCPNQGVVFAVSITIPDELPECPPVKLVRERYGFHPDTPREIMADRCRDDGDEELARKILTLP